MNIDELIPPGGDWDVIAPYGCITRLVVWRGKEVARVNPAGDFDDDTEGHIAMGLRAMPAACIALRRIRDLTASDPDAREVNAIAQAVIGYIEERAPPVIEPDC